MLRDFKSTQKIGKFRGWLSDTSKKSTYRQGIRLNIFLIVFAQYCIEAFLLYDTKWYRDNYVLIDRIDTIIVLLAVVDTFYFKTLYKYSDSNLVAFMLFVFIVLLQIFASTEHLNATVYINLFKGTLIAGGIVLTFLLIEKIFR